MTDNSKALGKAVHERVKHSLVLGVVEAVFALGEYFVLVLLVPTLAGLVLALVDRPPSYSSVLQRCVVSSEDASSSDGLNLTWRWVQTIGCILISDGMMVLFHFILCTLSCAMVVSWMMYRYINTKQSIKIRGLPPWLGLLTPRVSKLAVYLILYQIVGMLILIAIQAYTGSWYMGLANFVTPESDTSERAKLVGYFNVFNLVLFNPIKEEIVFRGCLFYILYRRSRDPLTCGVIANLLFGLFHLINILNGRFSSIYVLLQILLGLEIGMFYSARFFLLGSLWESISLHVANNLMAICVPVHIGSALSHPLLIIALLHTTVLFAVLGIYSWRRVMQNLHLTR